MRARIVEGECLIEVVEPAGSDTFAVTKLGGKEVVARLRADAQIVAGAEDAACLQPGQGRVLRSAIAIAHRRLNDRTSWAPDLQPSTAADIVIIGSGIGGATMAAGLAASGAQIFSSSRQAIICRIARKIAIPRAIFQRGFFRPKENWYDENGRAFNPGNYYNVGGNSKFYGAVLTRYRAEDFEEMQHLEGVSPAWPFPYEELEPWYGKAEALFQVRGQVGRRSDGAAPFHALRISAGSR